MCLPEFSFFVLLMMSGQQLYAPHRIPQSVDRSALC